MSTRNLPKTRAVKVIRNSHWVQFVRVSCYKPSELDQWIRACKGGQASDASFEKIYPFAQAICMGGIAMRVNKKLIWDAGKMQFTNSAEANQLMQRKYRKGWEL